MAVVAPFLGLTYDFYKMRDFSRLVAPPYDVISGAEQDALYEADPKNVVRLILGKKKTGDSDWDNRYTRAADYFKRWESDGTLIRADHPSLYLTSLTYELGDGSPPGRGGDSSPWCESRRRTQKSSFPTSGPSRPTKRTVSN